MACIASASCNSYFDCYTLCKNLLFQIDKLDSCDYEMLMSYFVGLDSMHITLIHLAS